MDLLAPEQIQGISTQLFSFPDQDAFQQALELLLCFYPAQDIAPERFTEFMQWLHYVRLTPFHFGHFKHPTPPAFVLATLPRQLALMQSMCHPSVKYGGVTWRERSCSVHRSLLVQHPAIRIAWSHLAQTSAVVDCSRCTFPFSLKAALMSCQLVEAML